MGYKIKDLSNKPPMVDKLSFCLVKNGFVLCRREPSFGMGRIFWFGRDCGDCDIELAQSK